jgi:UrcA family protein
MRHPALAAFAGLAGLAFAVPILAQTIDELVITGHSARARAETLSERVSYADLDLTQARDRGMLRQRVNAAAGRVCDQLGEARPAAGNLGQSCQEVAVRGASEQMRYAFAAARSGPAYAGSYAVQASATAPAYAAAGLSASSPVPDTPQNRARYGAPLSRAGRHTAADGR